MVEAPVRSCHTCLDIPSGQHVQTVWDCHIQSNLAPVCTEQVGAGLGGAVALVFAVQHPQLVAGLALLAYDPGQTLPAFHPAQAASFAGTS